MKRSELDIRQVQLNSLKERKHDLDLSVVKELTPSATVHENFINVAQGVVDAKQVGASVIFMMGAHVIRSGVQRYIIDLMKRGYISCISTNGAGVIHDYEFALMGATTESVARYIRDGRFGLWKETGQINEIINRAFHEGQGLGEAVGKEILHGDFSHKDISVFAQASKYGVPATVHVGIGYDIIHGHPNFNGAATGAASYKDFLSLAGAILNLESGVVMNFGSAVMAPEVFLKALSVARNIAIQKGNSIRNFTSLVCDVRTIPDDYSCEASSEDPDYFFRPWKTMLVRTVSDGGQGYYVRGKHGETVPALWTAINMKEPGIEDR